MRLVGARVCVDRKYLRVAVAAIIERHNGAQSATREGHCAIGGAGQIVRKHQDANHTACPLPSACPSVSRASFFVRIRRSHHAVRKGARKAVTTTLEATSAVAGPAAASYL